MKFIRVGPFMVAHRFSWNFFRYNSIAMLYIRSPLMGLAYLVAAFLRLSVNANRTYGRGVDIGWA
jgi:hypothetical protein